MILLGIMCSCCSTSMSTAVLPSNSWYRCRYLSSAPATSRGGRIFHTVGCLLPQSQQEGTRLKACHNNLSLHIEYMCNVQGTGLSYSGKLMAVGRARMDGVEVHGNSSLLGMSGFEAYAKSTAHRPAQFTFTSSGQSLQVILLYLSAATHGSSVLLARINSCGFKVADSTWCGAHHLCTPPMRHCRQGCSPHRHLHCDSLCQQ